MNLLLSAILEFVKNFVILSLLHFDTVPARDGQMNGGTFRQQLILVPAWQAMLTGL